ncbi:MAG TPA: bifunctional UDP-N-acetylglucosamine diphosphorylase/glucosamine-1-phosphate N-acetyltransferase GlmU [Gammaproteobacteria bacterium]|nr:bifunctional UDP-N-acetylglucosamine diphosphorylase/glucosamine-1-phosphate N-acetyltransferase GlmU [Gammaproteobacteria bacterium]
MPVSVVVLAAGQGKRMHSALPKVLQTLAGRPLLEHVIQVARGLEPAGIHVVYGYGGDAVRAAFASQTDLKWAHQPDQLGTGHAVAQALPAIPDDHTVLVLCGDVPLVRASTLERLVADADAGGGKLALLTANVADATGYGRVLRNARGAVTRIVEHKDASAEELRVGEINTGLIAFEARALRRYLGKLTTKNAQGEYYLTDVIGLAVADGVEVRGSVAESVLDVLGINDRAQLAAAERAFQRRVAADLMARGVTLADPERLDVRGSVTVGRDVFIDVGVVLEGKVVLGDRVHVGPYAVIADSTLGADTLVHAHTVMNGIAAGDDCEIGPFARLRPGAVLSGHVKVGNFVELKNSQVAPHSKINHLSYVGDTTVGAHVNVGAGTITCNYDGANKHRTVIGDNAFIGSGAMIVAPVEIGAGATIGAGSTITKDAPGGELTLARSKQVTVTGWQRPKKKPK